MISGPQKDIGKALIDECMKDGGAFSREADDIRDGDLPTALTALQSDVRVHVKGCDLALIEEKDGTLVVLNGMGGSGAKDHGVYRLKTEEAAAIRELISSTTE